METLKDIINGETPVLLEFFAGWCPYCKAMEDVLPEVKDTFGTKLRVVKVEGEKCRGFMAKYNARSFPTLILFEGGAEIWRGVGARPLETLVDELKNALILPGE